VVNNAGFAMFGPLLDLTDEQLKGNFDTNVFGQVIQSLSL
jgi:NAD(P)-dependent dehydrogenase (short-subunit alcohol dehydrogenase family)